MEGNMNTPNNILNFVAPKERSSYIKVFGVGGGGGNAVKHMYESGIKGVDFVVCNTDAQALGGNPVPTKIQLGRGLGAGNVPQVARDAALDKKEEIKASLANTKMLFITAGMGGGTGTGAAPVVAEIAKEIDLTEDEVKKILVVAIVTTPFSIEGRKRLEQAREGIELLRKNVDAILIINNDKLMEFGNMTIHQAFAMADDVLAKAARGIAELITVRSHVQIDFKDVNSVMSQSGVALMGCGEARGENRAVEALNQAVDSPLLNDNSIKGARNMLLYYSYGPDGHMRMDEFDAIAREVRKHTGNSADLIWGEGIDESIEGDLFRITLIATGFTEKKLSASAPDVVYLDEHETLDDTKNSTSSQVVVEEPAVEKIDDSVNNMSASEKECMGPDVTLYSSVPDVPSVPTTHSRKVYTLDDDWDTLTQDAYSETLPMGSDTSSSSRDLGMSGEVNGNVATPDQADGLDLMINGMFDCFSGSENCLEKITLVDDAPSGWQVADEKGMDDIVDSVFSDMQVAFEEKDIKVGNSSEDSGSSSGPVMEEGLELTASSVHMTHTFSHVPGRNASPSVALVSEPVAPAVNVSAMSQTHTVDKVVTSPDVAPKVRPVDPITERLEENRLRMERLKALSAMVHSKRGLKELEEIPAYMRARIILPEQVHSSVSEAGGKTIGADGEIQDNPAFLSDKAD